MKPLFLFVFFVLFSVSYARRFVAVTPDDHHVTTNPTSKPSSDDADSKIRLPTETRHESDLTESQPDLVKVDVDLTELMNRRPGHLRSRLSFPFIHYFPRRCRHNHKNHPLLSRYPGRVIGVGPGIEVELTDDLASLLKSAEIIGHRHVSRRFPMGERLAQFEQSFIPLPDLHRIHLDQGIVRAGVAVTRERVDKGKRENEEEQHDHHQRHHHEHEEDEMTREKHHDHEHGHGHHHDHDHDHGNRRRSM